MPTMKKRREKERKKKREGGTEERKEKERRKETNSRTRMQSFCSEITMFKVMLPPADFQCFCPNRGILKSVIHVSVGERETSFACSTVRGHFRPKFLSLVVVFLPPPHTAPHL